MTIPHIDAASVDGLLTWAGVVDSIIEGSRLGEPLIDDTLLRRDGDTLLSRSAWINGLGIAVKSATVFPDNASSGMPAVNGSVSLFDDSTGQLNATLDFHLVTKWKTAADSLLAARRLARPDAQRVLIVGAGAVASSMIDAYRSSFPDADVAVWNRTSERAEQLARTHAVEAVRDLESAVHRADIISTSTMAMDPLIIGAQLRDGQHLDLIGGYRPDMREADDTCIRRGRVFVDARASARDVGDICQPVASGILDDASIVADFTDLDSGLFERRTDDEITVFKNAGGAHLDLMVARHIEALVRESTAADCRD